MSIRVYGVGRVGDEPKALLVMLSARPTDDEIRYFHDVLARAAACVPKQKEIPSLRLVDKKSDDGEPK